jgi:hypothetical protein
MPTTQKLQQKHTKATQKVGGSEKKPATKAMEGGSAKKPAVTKAMEGGKVAPSKGKMTRGGSAKGGGVFNYQETKERSEDNRKLIIQLYMLINEIVKKLNRDLKTYYDFKITKHGATNTENIDDLNPLISNLNSNDKEYIRSIKKIETVINPLVYVKNQNMSYNENKDPFVRDTRKKIEKPIEPNYLAQNQNIPINENDDPFVRETRNNIGYGYK